MERCPPEDRINLAHTNIHVRIHILWQPDTSLISQTAPQYIMDDDQFWKEADEMMQITGSIAKELATAFDEDPHEWKIYGQFVGLGLHLAEHELTD